MSHLGYDTINNYSIGDDNSKYSNHIPMFNYIFKSKSPIEIKSQNISSINGKNEDWVNRLQLKDREGNNGLYQ